MSNKLPSLAAGLLASMCVLFQWWLPLAAILCGLPLVSFLVLEPFKGLIMWLMLSPAFGSYIQLSLPGGIPDLTFDRIVVGCFVLALVLRVMFRGGRTLPFGQTEKAMGLFVVMGLLDVFFRSETKGSDSLIFFDEYGIPFLLFVVAKNLFHSPEQIQQFVRVLFLVAVYLAVYGIYQFLTHGNLGTYEHDPATLGHLVEGRAVGPYVNAAIYGTVLTFAFVWTLYLVPLERWTGAQFFISMGLALIGLGIFVSVTRAVWLGFLAALFVVQLLDRKWRKPFVLGLLGVMLLSFALWFKGSDPSLAQERLVAEDSVQQRLVSYKLALLMSLAKPVFGYGRGDVPFATGRTEYLARIESNWLELGADVGPPHNQYLYTLVQYGLIGLAAYAAIFVYIVRSGITLMRSVPDPDSGQRQFVVLFWGMLAAYLVVGLFTDVVAFTFLGALLYIFAGVLDRLRLEVQSPNEASLRV